MIAHLHTEENLWHWNETDKGGPLVRYLEKQQIRQLLDVVTIAHAVVVEDVAVVPKFFGRWWKGS
jgi:hypothetical protein